MPYWEKSSEMYSLVESVIVNNAVPSKYIRKLVNKEDFDKEAEANQYEEYHGYIPTRRNAAKANSFNDTTTNSDENVKEKCN